MRRLVEHTNDLGTSRIHDHHDERDRIRFDFNVGDQYGDRDHDNREGCCHDRDATTSGSASTSSGSGTGVTYTLDATQSSAEYKARETLANIGSPTDAVGKTSNVTGTIVFTDSGAIDSSASNITIDLSTLQSDKSQRDNYIKQNTLDTDKYPERGLRADRHARSQLAVADFRSIDLQDGRKPDRSRYDCADHVGRDRDVRRQPGQRDGDDNREIRGLRHESAEDVPGHQRRG